MERDILPEELAARPRDDLLRLYVRFMARTRTDIDMEELETDRNWTQASIIRQYAAQLDKRWAGFVESLRRRGIRPDQPWSAETEGEERPTEADKESLRAELEKLTVKLETSHIINPA